jgi:hypothetical protein
LKQHQCKTILAAVKQIQLFELFNASLKSCVDAQQTDVLNNVYLPLGDKAKYINLMIPPSIDPSCCGIVVSIDNPWDSAATCHHEYTYTITFFFSSIHLTLLVEYQSPQKFQNSNLLSTSRKGRSMVLSTTAKERGRCNRWVKNTYRSSLSKA